MYEIWNYLEYVIILAQNEKKNKRKNQKMLNNFFHRNVVKITKFVIFFTSIDKIRKKMT